MAIRFPRRGTRSLNDQVARIVQRRRALQVPLRGGCLVGRLSSGGLKDSPSRETEIRKGVRVMTLLPSLTLVRHGPRLDIAFPLFKTVPPLITVNRYGSVIIEPISISFPAAPLRSGKLLLFSIAAPDEGTETTKHGRE